MSKLQELIDTLCPNGVEYKTIKEIATDIYRGAGIKRDEVTESGIPCVRYGEIYTTYGIWFDECVSHTVLENVKTPKYFEHGDILFAITGESVEEIAKSCAYIGNDKCLAGGDIVVLKHNQNPKYLSYALATTEAQQQKSKGKVKSKVVHSSVPAIEAITIPVPPMEVQSEIVRILDKFTELTAELTSELTSELTAREKQYEYYRSELLKCGMRNSECVMNGVQAEFKELKDVAEYSKERISYKYIDENTYIGVDNLLPDKKGKTKSTHLPTTGNLTKYTKGCILIGNIRPYLKKIWFADNDGGTNGDVLVVKTKTKQIIEKYLFYVLASDEFFFYNVQNSKGAKMPRGNKEMIMKYTIPVPPIEEQNRIVDILDRFDKLYNDISEGLSAEIELRKKQYEYYRDKLLSFNEI